MNCALLQTLDARGRYFPEGPGAHFEQEVATVRAPDDLKEDLGMQCALGSADRTAGASKSACLSDKLVLPQPKKVLLQALSPISSEGKLADSPAFNSPQRLSTSGTVICFDWDDTLLCTSWLSKLMDPNPTGEAHKHLRQIAQRSRSMLEAALSLGHTYIVTNSASAWVHYSSALWVPELLPLLHQVQIISAHDLYQHVFPGDTSQWKFHAFLEVRRQLISMPVENVLLLGGFDSETEGARAMACEFPTAHIKTVRFKPEPTVLEHLRQVGVVAEKFERIVRKPRSLTVSLEKKDPAAK